MKYFVQEVKVGTFVVYARSESGRVLAVAGISERSPQHKDGVPILGSGGWKITSFGDGRRSSRKLWSSPVVAAQKMFGKKIPFKYLKVQP